VNKKQRKKKGATEMTGLAKVLLEIEEKIRAARLSIENVEIALNSKSQVNNETPSSSIDLDVLSVREKEVFNGIGQGLKLEEIGHKLRIAKKTVEAHRDNIKKKLKIDSASDLIYRARRMFDK
jgi:DNA-binding NarL/FixJ family response regulator